MADGTCSNGGAVCRACDARVPRVCRACGASTPRPPLPSRPPARARAEYSEEVDEHIIQEEYKVWKKNAPFLYDTVITHALDWPSLTTQWLPLREEVPGGDYATHKLLLGTHTSGGADNHLMIANVKLPTEDAVIDARKYDEERGGAWRCSALPPGCH